MEPVHNLRFRWNDHVPHLSKVFSEQRLDEQYCNVTIVSEDAYIFKAHSIILSITSGYFERILHDIDPDQQPIIVLHGANYKELSCVMAYIYEGTTRVDHCLMESVLDLADMLEIKGLSKMKNNLSIKKLIAPSNHHSNISLPKTINPIASLSQTSDSQILKVNSEVKQVRESDLSMKDIRERLDKKLENIDLEEDTENSMDQTLGIDLSLSKNSASVSEIMNKDFGRNFNLPEESPLNKRKNILENSEEFQNATCDPDFGKMGDKIENIVPYKKKRFGTSLVTTPMMDLSTPSQEDLKTKSNEFTLEKLANMFSKEKSENGDSCYKNVQNILTCNKMNDKIFNDSEVEVSCSDGGLTISVTTGVELETFSDSCKPSIRQNSTRVSLSLRKSKKRFRTKREIEETKKKWLAKERKNLFTPCLLRRPNTRSKMKQKTVAEEDSSESVSINCDPPFPTGDSNNRNQTHHNSELREKVLPVIKEKHDKEGLTEAIKKVEDNDKLGISEFIEVTKKRIAISPLTLFTLPPTKDKERQTRTSLTLEEKIKVIESFLDGKSQRQIAKMYGIGKTQVNGIVKKREEILSLYRENLVNGEKLTMKRQRKSEYAVLNEHLIKWYRHMTIISGIKITTGMLRAKALQIAPELGCHDFKGSNGWLATFKTNNNLKFSKSKTKNDNDPNLSYEEESANNDDEETEFFEDEGDDGHVNNISGSSHSNPDNSVDGGESSSIHPGSTRSELHLDVGSNSTTQTNIIGGIGNISLGNSILSTSTLPKPPQMGNVALGSNLPYNLTRDHTRSEMTRSEISHLSDLHSPNVNPSSSLPHPTLSKPDAALSYKSEDSLSYGYDPQSRMNESSTRGTTEYNYHYGFPSTYYGYHFLGQY